MKRIILAVALIMTLGFSAFTVLASSPDINEFDSGFGHMNGNEFNRNRNFTDQERENWIDEERQEWMDERATHREERIEDALQEGSITEEEAAQFREENQWSRKNESTRRGFHHNGMRNRRHHYSTGGCHF